MVRVELSFELQWRATLRRTMILSVTVAATLASLCPILAQPSGSGSISSGHQIAITICGDYHKDPTSSRKTTVGSKLEYIANLTTHHSRRCYRACAHRRPKEQPSSPTSARSPDGGLYDAYADFAAGVGVLVLRRRPLAMRSADLIVQVGRIGVDWGEVIDRSERRGEPRQRILCGGRT